MRATEFIVEGVAEGTLSEKINLKTLTRGFVEEKDMSWYTLQAVGDFASRMANDPPTMEIYAMLKPESGKRQGKQIGQLSLKIAQGMFLKDNPGAEALVASGVDVDPAYQRKGVASAMYAFAKELGNDVIASVDQSDDAKAMWAGMRAKGVAEGLNESLSSLVAQDQSERNEYKNFVKSQAGGDWSKGAKMYAQLKKRPSNDIFGDATRLNQFMKMKFDFDKFTDEDWDNYWLLAQHCDDNRDFQKNALSIIKKYQGTDHSHYKYLYDRISMGLTGKQKYGTQNVKEQDVTEDN